MAELGKKPEYGLIFLLANALTAAMTYIFTLRGIAKQLNEAQQRVAVMQQTGAKRPSVKRAVGEPVVDAEIEFAKAHPGKYL